MITQGFFTSLFKIQEHSVSDGAVQQNGFESARGRQFYSSDTARVWHTSGTLGAVTDLVFDLRALTNNVGQLITFTTVVALWVRNVYKVGGVPLHVVSTNSIMRQSYVRNGQVLQTFIEDGSAWPIVDNVSDALSISNNDNVATIQYELAILGEVV